jgi:hypothetical protein
LPEEGIIVLNRGDLPLNRTPTEKQVFVTTIGDGGWHPYSQVQITQNPNRIEELDETFFMHHWTQPGLIPRDSDRDSAFENVGYFGHPNQLADRLCSESWEQFLSQHGLNWVPVHEYPDRQKDYSDIDLIVAIRGFEGRSYDYKPATKLHNAWRAGVPAILGPESAYQAERSDELDYLEARSYDELCGYIRTLKDRPALRSKLRKRSVEKGNEIDPDRKAERWWELLTGPVAEVHDRWTSLSLIQRKMFFTKRWLRLKKCGLKQRLS